jgi:hypothetical protein
MRDNATSFFVALVACAAAACTRPPTSEYVQVNKRPHPASLKQPDDVEIITTGMPTRRYAELGYFQAYRGSGEIIEVYAHLKQEGFKQGCDAVVVTDKDKRVSANAWSQTGTESVHSIAAVCIVYDDPSAAPGTVPPQGAGTEVQP